ncbi:MAG: hypothetical protein GY750_13950 [Lentisphaerae bacterium]|nr:hypothetical protein [Lentisphaerota bacterium]MCP4102503.1 hypothetical protein [Lentisphaerota bacterium]
MTSLNPENFILKRDYWLKADDQTLLKDCRLDFFKATGKGGQKRNKSSSAVRIIHEPTGIAVTDCSERSQHRNREIALTKLRLEIARQLRLFPPIPPSRIEVALKHREYPLWLARILDILTENEFQIKKSATDMQITTSKLIKLLERDLNLWQFINNKRMVLGLSPLKR